MDQKNEDWKRGSRKGSGLHNWVDGGATHWNRELEKIKFEGEIHEFDVDMMSLRCLLDI